MSAQFITITVFGDDTSAATMDEQDDQQIYLGYFATILLALIVAAFAGQASAPWIADFFAFDDVHRTSNYLTSALFFAASAANPVGFVLQDRNPAFLAVRVGLGIVFGLAVHHYLFEPIVGEALTRLAQLLIASLAVPVMILRDHVDAHLREHGSGNAKVLAEIVIRVSQWPDRVLFILMMMIAFTTFAMVSASINQTLAGILVSMLLMTMVAATRSAKEFSNYDEADTYRAWLEHMPDQNPALEPMDEARAEVARVLKSLGPGATFFGGLTWLARDVMPLVHPEIWNGLTDMSKAEISGLIAMTGLGVVMFGALVAVVIGIVALQIVGHYARWPRERRVYTAFWLLRAMSFRPMSRS